MNEERVGIVVEGVELISVKGDITLEKVDAIVNAANSRLNHGGGVAGAIARAAGPSLQEESWLVAPVRTGSAAATLAGNLPCRLVIHAVGPIWAGGKAREVQLLQSAVRKTLEIAVEEDVESISFPSISAGIFGMPGDTAAGTLVDTIVAFIKSRKDTTLKQVRLCNIDNKMVEYMDSALNSLATV